MTETEFVKVLQKALRRAEKPDSVLGYIDKADFPKRFFKTVGESLTYEVVLSIYEGLTVKHQTLCSVEKAIVKDICLKDKDSIPVYLRRLCLCFLKSDLTDESPPV